MARRRTENSSTPPAPQEPQLSRRVFLAGLCGVVASAAGAALYLRQDDLSNSPSQPVRLDPYQEARNNPAVRPAFVRNLEAYTTGLPYVQSVVYRPGIPGPRENSGMAIDGVTLDDLGKSRASVIQIYDFAFEAPCLTSFNDFLSVFIDHEIDGHAKLYYYGSKDIDRGAFLCREDPQRHWGELYIVMLELVAFQNQLQQADMRNISPTLRRETGASYFNQYFNLVNPQWDDKVADTAALRNLRVMMFPHPLKNSNATINGVQVPIFSADGQMTLPQGTLTLPPYLAELANRNR